MAWQKMKKAVGFSLSDKTIAALNYFSEKLGISKSSIVSLAINRYFMEIPEYRYDNYFRALVGEDEISAYENAHGK